MKRIALLSLVVAGLTFALMPPAVGATRNHSDCGTIAGEIPFYNVAATSTSCHRARQVAKHWLKKIFAHECTRFDCRVRGFTCHAKPPARIHYLVRCKRPIGKRVRWQVVVD